MEGGERRVRHTAHPEDNPRYRDGRDGAVVTTSVHANPVARETSRSCSGRVVAVNKAFVENCR